MGYHLLAIAHGASGLPRVLPRQRYHQRRAHRAALRCRVRSARASRRQHCARGAAGHRGQRLHRVHQHAVRLAGRAHPGRQCRCRHGRRRGRRTGQHAHARRACGVTEGRSGSAAAGRTCWSVSRCCMRPSWAMASGSWSRRTTARRCRRWQASSWGCTRSGPRAHGSCSGRVARDWLMPCGCWRSNGRARAASPLTMARSSAAAPMGAPDATTPRRRSRVDALRAAAGCAAAVTRAGGGEVVMRAEPLARSCVILCMNRSSSIVLANGLTRGRGSAERSPTAG